MFWEAGDCKMPPTVTTASRRRRLGRARQYATLDYFGSSIRSAGIGHRSHGAHHTSGRIFKALRGAMPAHLPFATILKPRKFWRPFPFIIAVSTRKISVSIALDFFMLSLASRGTLKRRQLCILVTESSIMSPLAFSRWLCIVYFDCWFRLSSRRWFIDEAHALRFHDICFN